MNDPEQVMAICVVPHLGDDDKCRVKQTTSAVDARKQPKAPLPEEPLYVVHRNSLT